VTLARVTATRFVAPLREGGSLPGIIEADDLGTYVCKFRGAGQGLPVLVAEVIVSGLAEALGLHTPRLVTVDLTEPIARYEADEEVQDLLNASLGLNLGVDFLPGSFGFDSAIDVSSDYAARVLWLDGFVANVDRSWRNPNLLVWHGKVWVIDHGASLYFHHAWSRGLTDPARFADQPWSVDDHVLAAHLDAVAGLADETRRADHRRGACRRDRQGAGRVAGRSRLPGRVQGGVRRVPSRPPRRIPGLAAETRRGMSAPMPYQYVVLRCVPRVDREEFVNVGVLVYCQEADFLAAGCRVDAERLHALWPELDADAVRAALAFVDGVCRGDAALGAAATGDLGVRFGFLKAPRSTVVQPGPVHGGITADPVAEVERLLDLLVR